MFFGLISISLAVPPANVQLPLHGAVHDATGVPLAGTHALTFRLLDEGGTAIWQETATTALNGGAFAVRLGSVTPLAAVHLRSDLARAITVAVDGGTPSAPTSLDFAPRATWASDAGALGGVDASAFHQKGTALQLGDTTATCDGGTLGLMRWTGTVVEVCTIGGWIDVGSGPSIAALDGRLTALEGSLGNAGTDIANLQADLVSLSADVQNNALSVQSSVSSLESSVSTLQSSAASAESSIASLQTSVSTLQNTVGNLSITVACPSGAYLSGINGSGNAICTPEKNGFEEITTGVWNTCGRMTDGTVKCWGYAGANALGNKYTANQSRPVSVVKANGSTLTDVVDLDTGWEHSCVIVKASAGATSGAVWCWGANSAGQLGDGTTAGKNYAVQVAGITNAVQVQAGYLHSCARLSTGAMKCWGYNNYGQLGFNGNTVNQSSPVDVYVSGAIPTDWIDVSLGSHHTCGVRSNGSAWCWGWNGHGHLGDGTTTNRTTPVQVSGFNSGVTDIEAAVNHQTDGNWYDYTCAIRSGGAWCWGRGANFQLGDGTSNQRSTPVQVQVDANDDGTSEGNLADVRALSLGAIHSCAIAGANRTAYCWGWNGYSAFAATTVERSRAIAVAAPDGNGYMTNVKQLSCSEYQVGATMFVLQGPNQAYGEGFAMGDNTYGRLGDGTSTNTQGWATPVYMR